MSGGVIVRCDDCRRLILLGQQCMCQPNRQSRCDCTHDGNEEHVGPECLRRERAIWSSAMRSIRDHRTRPAHHHPAASTEESDRVSEMTRVTSDPIEGVVVEDRSIEDFCQGVVESMTAWDWVEVPEELRQPLRDWATAFAAWIRADRAPERGQA